MLVADKTPGLYRAGVAECPALSHGYSTMSENS